MIIKHNKYEYVMFLKNNMIVKNKNENIEILTVNLRKCLLTTINKLPNERFIFEELKNFKSNITRIVTGDFNSHSINWGYPETNDDRSEKKDWAET